MENSKKALLDEFFELSERRERLLAFIDTNPDFGKLDERQQYYMNKQLDHMTYYQECLDARIKDLVSYEEIEAYKRGDPPASKEDNIIADKSYRVAIDTILQGIKKLPQSPERSVAAMKLQEGIMWLGMDLKRLGGENPYPNSMNPDNTVVEPTADGMRM